MDAFTAITVAIITAASGIISGLVVAYFKPSAEDRAQIARERRAARKERLDRLWQALLTPEYRQRREIPTLAAAIGDPALSAHLERFLRADDEDEQAAALEDARKRLGELMGQ